MGKGQGEREKGVAAEEDLTELERKVDLEQTRASLWVFVRAPLCVTNVSTLGMRRGRGTHVDEKRWLQTQIYVI